MQFYPVQFSVTHCPIRCNEVQFSATGGQVTELQFSATGSPIKFDEVQCKATCSPIQFHEVPGHLLLPHPIQ